MKSNVKSILLTGSALVAASFAGAGMANAQQVIGAGTTAITTPTNGTITLNDPAAIGTVADGETLGHNVEAGTPGVGTLQTLGNATVLDVGTGGAPVGTVDINGGAGTTASFGAVHADNLTFTGSAGATAVFNGSSAITNTITTGANTMNVGTGATLTATGGITGATGTIGLDGTAELTGGAATIGTVEKTGAGTATISSEATIGAVNVVDGTLSITDAGSTVSGATTLDVNTLDFGGTSLASVAGAGGTLNLTANGDQSVTGAVGAAGNALSVVGINGTGTKTFANADFYADSVNFGAAGTADLTAVTTAGSQTIDFGTNDGTVNFADGITYSGSSTNGATGNGNLNFGNGSSIDAGAIIGSLANKLKSLTFGTGTNVIDAAIHADTTNVGAGSLTSSNTTFNSDINFTDDGTVTLADNTTDVGAVTTATAGTGTLIFSGGPLTIGGVLQQLKALALTQDLIVNGNAVAADSMNVAGNTMTVNGTFDTTADTNLIFNVNSAISNGMITATGAVTVHADTGVTVYVDTADYIAQDQEFILIDGSAAASGGVSTLSNGKLTTTNTALLNFRQKTSDTDSLIVYADRTQMNTAATNPNNAAVGTMLDALGAGGDADIDALQVRLANFGTTAEVESVLSTLTPDVSGGVIAAGISVGGSTGSVVDNRLASLRAAGDYESGMVAGNAFQNYHFWGQVFGATADQSRRDNIAGYDANTYGFVGGVDTNITDDFRAGVAVAYANTDVDGKDSNRTKTDINSYQLSLYGDVDLRHNIFLSGQVSYMYGDIETRRHNVGGLAANTAEADFNSDQFGARAELGRKFALDSRFAVTPSLLANYSYIDISDYSETGAGGLGLSNVRTDDMEIFELGAKLRGEATFDDLKGGLIKPSVHAGYRYDFIGDSVATLGSLSGGGAAFRTNGFDPAQSTVNVGAGLKWELQNNLEFTANYDYEYKSDYDAHAGYVRAGYKF